jgi:subtilisin family serine protease
MNHAEITIHQCQQLVTLQNADTRRDLQTNLRLRRAHGTPEPDERFRRPALELVGSQRRATDDAVVVAAAELLVDRAQAKAAIKALAKGFGQQPARATRQFTATSVCDGVDGLRKVKGWRRVNDIQRIALPRAIPLADAISHLQSSGITATVNHVAMMGGTAKGGATPKATTDTITAQVKQSTGVKPPRKKRKGTLVVVIDTGIDANVGRREDSWVSYVDAGAPIEDVDPLDVLDPYGVVDADGRLDLAAGHGTFVAGVVSQVAPHSQVVMLRAIATDGVCTEDALVRALCRAAALFRKRKLTTGVVNLSLGLESVDGEEPPILRTALDLLPDDVVVVAAAGNAKTGVKLWPAASDRVCGVASLDQAGQPSTWSNCGDWVDFSARGEGVISTFVEGEETASTGEPGNPFDEYPDAYAGPTPVAVWSGTSFATPQIAGRLAEIIEQNRGISRADAIRKLKRSGTFIKHYGHRVAAL